MLNSLACDGVASTCPDSVRPLIDIGSLDVVSFMLMFVMSGVRDGTTRGKLKKPEDVKVFELIRGRVSWRHCGSYRRGLVAISYSCHSNRRRAWLV